MDGHVDGEWMDGQMDGHVDGRCMYVWMNIYIWLMGGWVHRCMGDELKVG